MVAGGDGCALARRLALPDGSLQLWTEEGWQTRTLLAWYRLVLADNIRARREKRAQTMSHTPHDPRAAHGKRPCLFTQNRLAASSSQSPSQPHPHTSHDTDAHLPEKPNIQMDTAAPDGDTEDERQQVDYTRAHPMTRTRRSDTVLALRPAARAQHLNHAQLGKHLDGRTAYAKRARGDG